jgi:glycosyltransferase involved in cell wall biosynthesis
VSHHSDVEFLIVGDGPLKKELQSYVQQIGITKYVTFAGIQKDIPRILARTDIFVLPSFWEGLPLTVMEAMSAGRPVVLTNVGGNRDLIHSGEEGFLVEAGNIDELVKNIIYLIDHTDQRLSMGRAARIRSLEQFTMDRYITQHEYLYKEIYGS